MEFIRKKNRKLVCLLLSLIMAASVLTPLVNTYAAQVDCTDKILNPSFEIGTVGQAPSNWTRTGGTYANKSPGGYNGSYMARNSNQTTPGAAGQNTGTSDTYLTQTVTGLENGLYKLTAMFRSSYALPANTANWPYLSVNNYQTTGAAEIRQSFGVSIDWSEKAMYVNVTNGQMLIRLGFGYSLTALQFSCWDDLRLTWISEPLPEGNIRSFVAPAAVSTIVGVAPTLPETVNATFLDASGGTSVSPVPVAWDPIPAAMYQNKGSFTVTGTLPNSGLIVSVTVNVDLPARNYDVLLSGPNVVVSGADFAVRLNLSKNPSAPSGLSAYLDEFTVEFNPQYMTFVGASSIDGKDLKSVVQTTDDTVNAYRVSAVDLNDVSVLSDEFIIAFKAKEPSGLPVNTTITVSDAKASITDDAGGSGLTTTETLAPSAYTLSISSGASGGNRTNVALNRMAFQSSSSFYGGALSTTTAIYYNYAETAQLVTDGITDSSQLFNRPVIAGKFNNDDKDYGPARAFETSPETKYRFEAGTDDSGAADYGWISYKFPNGERYAAIALFMQASDNYLLMPSQWVYEASNDDGATWTQIGATTAAQNFTDYTGNTSKRAFSYAHTTAYEMYRIRFTAVRAENTARIIEIGNIELGTDSTTVASTTSTTPFKSKTDTFTSRWTSGKSDPQWVYIDLGKQCVIDGFKLYWDICYAKEYSISYSNDAKNWTDLYRTISGQGGVEEGMFAPVEARYVKMTGFKRSDDKMGYQLKEFEVYGTSPFVITPKPQPAPLADGTQYLTGGAWKIQKAAFVNGDGLAISAPGFDDSAWNVATVPGTVLMSYVNNGSVPNPNVANFIECSSDTFFTADFWYRDTFTIPAEQEGGKTWLNFDGINWKAQIYLNGSYIGRIDGAFMRGKFDISSIANYGGNNYLAVKIIKNDTTGNAKQRTLLNAGGNGGNLGNDSPSFHASIGWDWGGTARGRNNGIYNNVYVSYTGSVTLVDPFVKTDVDLATLASADVDISTEIKNNTGADAQNITVSAVLNPGNIKVSGTAGSVAANTSIDYKLDTLHVDNPQLWWPNGYGDPFLYDLEISVVIDGKVSDTKNIKIGIRKITYDTGSNNRLWLYCNGERIVLLGGNWGMSDINLALDRKGYDDRVRLHRDMNFTMIRNWVGMVENEAFYDACDKYGILIDDDFWLANPSDGANPKDETMFMNTARDKIKRIRNHPSLVIYCGRNEGNPPTALNTALSAACQEFDGTRIYVPASNAGPMSGNGPYGVQDPRQYFNATTAFRLHTEMGQMNIPTYESLVEMYTEQYLWPINDVWGMHDFTQSHGYAFAFQNRVDLYGKPLTIKDFERKAQMVAYESHKAMYEAMSIRDGAGLLMWMSNPAWPSTVWQTYDHYLDINGGYAGVKKASERIHILMHATNETVYVVNKTQNGYTGTNSLAFDVKVYNLDGAERYSYTGNVSAASDSINNTGFVIPFASIANLSDTHFVVLKLKNQNGEILSTNYYWRTKNSTGSGSLWYPDYQQFNEMETAEIEGSAYKEIIGDRTKLTATIANANGKAAVMVRFKVTQAETGERILPVFYSDEYFLLLPGEIKTVSMDYSTADAFGSEPLLFIEGFNVDRTELSVSESPASIYRNVALRRAAYHSSVPNSNYNNTAHLVTDGIIDSATNFASNWTSRGNSNEYVYIDLGAVSEIDKTIIYWGANYATSYDIQVSNDAKSWVTVASNNAGTGGVTTDTFEPVTAKYVRLLAKTSSGTTFIVREMEVYGKNAIAYSVGALPKPEADGTQYLRGGNWKLQKASEVTATGAQLASADYDDATWLPATVPGTVLMSYLKAGALPDPNISDQQLLISESFFTADFWYRDSFVIPTSREGHKVWLNFDAINWKADIYFNGHNVGRIDGSFIRGKFDVTQYVNYGEENYLAVYIIRNANPGNVTVQTASSAGGNGGTLGQDNPTIHASIGWDWVPTIRGRNIGIYEDVFITYDQDVQLLDPWVVTDLDVVGKDFSTADLYVKTDVKNTTGAAVEAVISGTIQPGGLTFSQTVSLAAGESKSVDFDKLVMNNPKLWWPNTYGEQPLYTADITLSVGGERLDHKSFKFGIRKFTYDPGSSSERLTIYCNGTRVSGRGGNWGMDDSNLAATEEDYDIKIRLHAEANLTMIRNWVGMTNHKAFYEACDKYGIMIWDDFWLANPSDGPVPNDNAMFLNNAQDKVKRNRYHAALTLYCGRNEGNPPTALDTGLRNYTSSLDGTRIYIPHSATMPVSGNGPYTVQDPVYYFDAAPMTLHSERGLPNVPALESMKAMLTPDHYWPMDVVWGIHDFTTGSAQNGNKFMTEMRRYANFNSLEEFVRIAQMVNYDNHKALFAGTMVAQGNGMLMWMSQSAWPSMVWQTYDYYYDTNAGYFGLKHGSQPINAIWDPRNDDLVLVNATPDAREDLRVVAKVYDLGGNLVREDAFTADIGADGKLIVGKVKFPPYTSDIKFIRTYVFDEEGKQIAEDFSWTNTKSYQSYAALAAMSKTYVQTEVLSVKNENGVTSAQLRLSNTTRTPALMIRLKTLVGNTDELVLPVYYDDNYISLMPGEEQVISLEFDTKRLNGRTPGFAVEGWNVFELRVGETPEAFIEETITRDGVLAQNVESGSFVFEVKSYFATQPPFLTPVLAVYKNSKLFASSIAEHNTAVLADGVYTLRTQPVVIPDGDDLDQYSIKAFLWDGDYIPLREPKVLGGYVVDWVKLPDLLAKKSYIVEGFNYASSAELSSSYTNNSSATSQSFELIDAPGLTVNGKAARLNYSINSSGYAGRYKAFSGNWSAFDHYCLWIKGDGKRGDVILQLSADWEAHLNTFNGQNGLPYYDQNSIEWQYLEIPFSEFRHRNYPTNLTPLDSTQINRIAFYVNAIAASGAISGGQLCYGDVSVKAKNKPFSTLDFVPIDRQECAANTLFTFAIAVKLADGDGVYSDPAPGQVAFGVEDAPDGITISSSGVVSVNAAQPGKYIITIVAEYNGTVYRTTVPIRITAA